jgi:hypothetical protein
MVLAAAAVEAHVGEWLALEDHRKLLETEIEEWKKSLPRPPQIIKTIVSKTSGTTIGSLPWFDRLQGLFELRNHAVHYYPERRPLGQFPEKLEDYIRRRVITPVGTDDMDWTSRLLVSSVAEQALCIAFEAIRGFDTEVATDDRAV